MAITKAQAIKENTFHIGSCTRTVGPRGGETVQIAECRRNGQTKTWKTRPDNYMVPVKRGLYEYGYISHSNNENFHTPEDCPLGNGALLLWGNGTVFIRKWGDK